MNKLSPKLKVALLVVLISFMALVLLEAGLRIAGAIATRPYQRDGGNATVILALGESSTAGLWVDWNESYPAQLESILKKAYPGKEISVVVPVHMGQNTGQIANRIGEHLEEYRPDLILLMVGYNNEWSLAESRIARFVGGKDAARIRLLTFLDRFRSYRLLRYLYLRFVNREDPEHVQRLESMDYVWGGPELARFPPEGWVYSFAMSNRGAFVELWRYDVTEIVQAAKDEGVPVLLMTYHINPTYLSGNEFERLANDLGIPLVRNDLLFFPLIQSGEIRQYVFPYDNWHPNARGYRLIAANIAGAIYENDLL